MVVNPDPQSAADYHAETSDMVRRTCLEVATHLGDHLDDLRIVGGLVPSLLIPEDKLRDGEDRHIGTVDLDLGFSLAVLEGGLYEEIAKRLAAAGFGPDKNENDNSTSQRWVSPQGITIDFLIPPSGPEDEGGRLRNLAEGFAGFIIPGLDLAFRDFVTVAIEDELPEGSRATREVQVCGPMAFVVLKALAFDGRGTTKDAYDLAYMLRHHPMGAEGIGTNLPKRGEHESADRACQILVRDFHSPELVGPGRASAFLGGDDAAIRADTAGLVRAFLAGGGRI